MKKAILFVDIQKDFMLPNGKLYIQGAETIIPALKELFGIYYYKIQKEGDILCGIWTADWHEETSKEISNTPDFKTTFPVHCVKNTDGAKILEEASPMILKIIDYNKPYKEFSETFKSVYSFLIYKDAFDVFEGNPNTEEFFEKLEIEEFTVCGVASNVCVDFAVMGLLKRGYKVNVVTNAIKELPGCDVGLLYVKWLDAGATLVSVKGAKERL